MSLSSIRLRRWNDNRISGAVWMDFQWSDDQLAYRDSLLSFAREHLAYDVDRLDRDGEFAADSWKKCAEFGIQGLPVPEVYGGQEADPLTIALALETLGYVCRDNGLLFSIGAHIWSCVTPVARFGSEDQKRQYLPGLCDGSLIGVQGMTEPGSGSDAFSLATKATQDGDHYVLNGSKLFITNAPVADVFIIFAATSPDLGSLGLSAFIVDRATPGLVVGRSFEKMGLRSSPMSELVLTECRVHESQRLGPQGGGMAIFNHSMDWERSFIMATAVGTMQRQLDTTAEYTRQRQQFGRPIAAFQAVSHQLVDMKVRLETCRLLLYRLAWMHSVGRPAPAEAALVKLVLSESFVETSLTAIQLRGAYGFVSDSGVERDLRDAVGGRIYSGTSEIQRNLVARGLGL